VKERHYGDVTVDQFTHRLAASLSAWRAAGKRGVWLTIPLNKSDLIPVAAKVSDD